jgi:hypothetical protein
MLSSWLFHGCNDKYSSKSCFSNKISCSIHGKFWICSLDNSPKHIFCYIQAIKDMGIKYDGKGSNKSMLKIQGWIDFD